MARLEYRDTDLFGDRIIERAKTRVEVLSDYEGFVEKFRPKKTTDDCYTPPLVYDAVLGWLDGFLGLAGRPVLRPFYPGGDYTREEYPEGCVVVDNPPFSILSQIVAYYLDRGIDFFLFAPTLTLFHGARDERVAAIVCGHPITYNNGAQVNTSFLTSLLPGVAIRIDQELNRTIVQADQLACGASSTRAPKYEYPDNVVSAAMLQALSRAYADLEIPRSEVSHVSKLDAQRAAGKSIFGSGFLLSDRCARLVREARAEAELRRAEVDRERTVTWELSPRELGLVSALKNI